MGVLFTNLVVHRGRSEMTKVSEIGTAAIRNSSKVGTRKSA